MRVWQHAIVICASPVPLTRRGASKRADLVAGLAGIDIVETFHQVSPHPLPFLSRGTLDRLELAPGEP